MVSPLAIFSTLLVAIFMCSLKSNFELNMIPSHFIVPWWVMVTSPSGLGRVMVGKTISCFLVKCVSLHLMKSIESPSPCRMCSVVRKSAHKAIMLCNRLVEELYRLTSSM